MKIEKILSLFISLLTILKLSLELLPLMKPHIKLVSEWISSHALLPVDKSRIYQNQHYIVKISGNQYKG